MSQVTIEVSQLRRCFGETVALDGVSFSARAGEVVGVLGENGAGKTTCMRIIAAFLPPTSGSVHVCGYDVSSNGVAARVRLGYLPEEPALYPELRVAEYLEFRARLKRVGRTKRGKELQRVSHDCQLSQVWRRPIGQLSRGYRQRVGIADALLGSPVLIMLDEPTSGLDPNQSRQVDQLLRTLRGAKHTVLLSSHILPRAEAVCDRLLILDRGRIIAEGTPAEIRQRVVSCRVRVVARGDAAAITTALRGVAGAERVVEQPVPGDGGVSLLVEGTADGALRERIAAAVSRAGGSLRELVAEPTPLDDVFAQLTGADRPVACLPDGVAGDGTPDEP